MKITEKKYRAAFVLGYAPPFIASGSRAGRRTTSSSARARATAPPTASSGGRWTRPPPPPGAELVGSTLAIFSDGEQEMAGLASSFLATAIAFDVISGRHVLRLDVSGGLAEADLRRFV